MRQFKNGMLPFRTGGRGVVELVENGKNVFVQSISFIWNGEKYANPRPELKDYATTVIAFRSSDGGLRGIMPA